MPASAEPRPVNFSLCPHRVGAPCITIMIGGDADPPKGKRPPHDEARTVAVIEEQLAKVQEQLCWEAKDEERAAELERQEAALQKELEKKKQQETDGAPSEAVQQRSGMRYEAPKNGVWRLKEGITLRGYQCDDLARIFATEPAQLLAVVSSSGSESESPLACPAEGGLIRYPCGAGKTLLLISMALAVKQHVLIVVPDNLISQWEAQLLEMTQLTRRDLAICSCNESEQEGVRLHVRPRVVIASFTYLAKKNEKHTPDRPIRCNELYKELVSCHFALTLVDECQNMSAPTSWEGLQRIPERGALFGATGSLYRESVVKGVPMIETLHQRFAGQRVMLSFKQLMDEGFIARVRIFEVEVPLPPAWKEKLAAGGLSAYDKTLHNILSPRLLEQALARVLRTLSSGGKAIVYVDTIQAIEHLGRLWGVPIIYGETPKAERERVLSAFKAGTERFVLFSHAMTEGFDLGPVELVCELDTNGASRSQMLQRLGRATRNPANGTQAHADFVSFVSCDSAQQVRQRARAECLGDDAVCLESEPGPLLNWHQLPEVHELCRPECQDDEATPYTPELRSWVRLHVEREREQHEADALEEVARLCREHYATLQ